VVSLCFISSFFINLLGAAHGVMLCDYPQSAVARYLSEMNDAPTPIFPLAFALAVPVLVCAVLFLRELVVQNRLSNSITNRVESPS
jgi:hypothetical protein